jgi:hypothetical protein
LRRSGSPVGLAHDDIKLSFFSGKTGVFQLRCTFDASGPKNRSKKPLSISSFRHLGYRKGRIMIERLFFSLLGIDKRRAADDTIFVVN